MMRRKSSNDFKARYEGAGQGRRLGGWAAPSSGPVRAIGPALPSLRNRARDAVRNEPLAAAAVRLWVNGLVGSGIVARLPDAEPEARRRIESAWRRWMPQAEFGGGYDFYGLQSLAVRSMIESGECFIRLRYRKPTKANPEGLQIQVLESDQLPSTNTILPNGHQLIQGIEFDADVNGGQ